MSGPYRTSPEHALVPVSTKKHRVGVLTWVWRFLFGDPKPKPLDCATERCAGWADRRCQGGHCTGHCNQWCGERCGHAARTWQYTDTGDHNSKGVSAEDMIKK